jgi:hypothetical protein
MPGPNYVLDKGFIIDAAAGMFTAQKLTAVKEHATLAGVGEQVIGILQETVSAADAATGRTAAVRIDGIARCLASAAVAVGARLVCAANGKMVTATTGANQNQVGIAMTAAAADNDHFDVLLTPGVRLTI